MKLSELAVDPDRQENGAWVDDIPEVQGLRLKVRGAQNADWRKLQAKLLDAVPRKKRLGGRLDPDENDAIMTKCLLNCCLLDWDGLEDEQGNAIPFDKDYARKLITEPEFRRFRDSVIWAANVVQEKTEDETDDNLGNLVKLSDGNTAGERSKKAG
jgi:hypothetical protein